MFHGAFHDTSHGTFHAAFHDNLMGHFMTHFMTHFIEYSMQGDAKCSTHSAQKVILLVNIVANNLRFRFTLDSALDYIALYYNLQAHIV